MNEVEDILAQRGEIYGDMAVTHARIAHVWSGILGTEVTGHQVALCMTGLKLVRAACSPDHKDSYLDAKGYTTIAEHIADQWDEQ